MSMHLFTASGRETSLVIPSYLPFISLFLFLYLSLLLSVILFYSSSPFSPTYSYSSTPSTSYPSSPSSSSPYS